MARSAGFASRRSVRHDQGLTLLEVLAAMTLLSLVVMSFLVLYNQMWTASVKSSDRLDAVHLAETQMSQWLADPNHDYAHLQGRMGKASSFTDPLPSPPAGWSGQIKVSLANGSPGAPLQVAVTVVSPRGVSTTLYTLVSP
ncbi:MAG: prepilin-type N-terminal cleavage/methylation domain-containing protein [Alicyclobacillaceae bacterium]|nr:prepilin-type N-terminal cleavage/methylation domain-containing protein [Alicyclobacillaceae bacterium]